VWEVADSPKTQVGLVLGVWLSGVFAASLGGRFEAGKDGTTSMLLLGAAVLWPILYFALSRCRFVPQSLPFGATVAVTLFALVSALSSFLSPVMYLSTGYVVLTLAGIWLALQFNSNLDADQYEWGLKVFAVLMTGLLLGFAWYDYAPGKRLGMGKELLNPNTIALVACCVLLATMAIRTILLRLLFMAPLAAVIFLTGSRTSACAAAIGLLSILLIRFRTAKAGIVVVTILCTILAAGLTVAYGDVLYGFLDRFFALSTADRGIGSGFTGRLTAWNATWELFLRNPMLGVGFRAHEHILKVDTSAHNGYLATLAEVGIVGFLAVLYLVIRGLRLLLANIKDPNHVFSYSILFGLCVGYLLLAVFERYLINVGNPTSLLFLLSIMRPGIVEGHVPQEDEMLLQSLEESAVG
jgi:O-antigen ligase